MDRRQRKTRESIFKAFTNLLKKNNFNQITVSEIIDKADIGRATFYSHFETKDFLLKELCFELFDHIFESEIGDKNSHTHIFDCQATNSVFLHLLQHIKKNDNNLFALLSCENNDLFLKYFKNCLKKLIKNHLNDFSNQKKSEVPEDFWINHIASTFVETIRWWIENEMLESPETITKYFFTII